MINCCKQNALQKPFFEWHFVFDKTLIFSEQGVFFLCPASFRNPKTGFF